MACSWLHNVQNVTPPLSWNLLLGALPRESLARLEGQMRVSELMIEERLFEADTRTEIYFPLDGVVSLLRPLENGTEVEVGMVGADGFIGINAVLGVPLNPLQGLVQGRGYVARIDPAAIRAEMQREPRTSDVLLRFVYAFFTSVSQLTACNRLHSVEERLAHWLLLLTDRVGAPEMSVTQEFLARMLAVRRAGINEAIRALRDAGCIEHGRNRIRILDRKHLEDLSCECYSTTRMEYERTFGFPPILRQRSAEID